MAEVLNWRGITRLDLDPDKVLKRAIGEVTEVVILGYDQEGEFYFASSIADGGSVLWHLEKAKMHLLKVGEDG